MSSLTNGAMATIGSGILVRLTPTIADIFVFNGATKELYLIRYTVGSGVTTKTKFSGTTMS